MSSGLEEKIQKITERLEKLEEENKKIKHQNKKLQKKNKYLENKITNKTREQNSEKEEISRRGFLKKLGAGAVGLGALSLAPAAGRVTISDNGIEGSNGLDFLDSGSNYFKVNSGGPVEIQNTDLRIPTGKYVRDGGGDAIIGTDGTGLRSIYSYSGKPFRIQDGEGNFTAVQYDTDSSAGVLRTPNAGLRVEGNGSPSSGVGVEVRWTGSTGIIGGYDYSTSNWQDLIIRGEPLDLRGTGGLIDMSNQPADLRLATGQGIEDGSGQNRIRLDNNHTDIKDETGTTIFRAFDDGGTCIADLSVGSPNLRIANGQAIEGGGGTKRIFIGSDRTSILDDAGQRAMRLTGGFGNFFDARSGQPFVIYDQEGGVDGVQYLTDPNKGTLELTNSRLEYSTDNDIAFHNKQAHTGYVTNSDVIISNGGSGDILNLNGAGGGMVMVHGTDDGAAGREFTDIVLIADKSTTSSVGSVNDDSPTSRSYSMNSGSLNINLSGDGASNNNYVINCNAFISNRSKLL